MMAGFTVISMFAILNGLQLVLLKAVTQVDDSSTQRV